MRGVISEFATWGAERWGDRAVIAFPGDRTLSFADVDALAGAFAGGLAAQGVGVGDRVVLHLPNSWQWVVAYHAIARLGAVVVPANILLSAAEVHFLTSDSGARLAILPGKQEFAPDLGVVTVRIGKVSGRDIAFDAMLHADSHASCAVTPDALFTIGYTSGTTGRPKGAMLSHGNIFASVAHTATFHVRHEGDRIYSALPFPHVYGNVVLNACFLTGAWLYAPQRFVADEALAALGRERITVFEGVPTMYYQMLASQALASADVSSLTRCTVGGQTMPVAKLDAAAERFGCPILELWGMTEVGGPATTHSPYWTQRHGSIGLPLPGLETRLAALDGSGTDVGDEPGELLVRGPLVTAGYWNDEAATRSSFVDGWFATGDVARRDADGYLYIVDRKKEMILTAGYNVYPAELEQVIAMHPDVAMVAVAGFPDEEKGEVARAFVVRHRNSMVNANELASFCREHLAAYKIPRAILFVDDLPRTGTGKIMRRMLNDLDIPSAQPAA